FERGVIGLRRSEGVGLMLEAADGYSGHARLMVGWVRPTGRITNDARNPGCSLAAGFRRRRSAAGQGAAHRAALQPEYPRPDLDHAVHGAQPWLHGVRHALRHRRDEQDPAAGGGEVDREPRSPPVDLRDAQPQVNALSRGEVDIIEQPAFESYAPLKADKNVQVVNSNPLGFQYMCRFNHLHPPFNNRKIREAALAAMPQEPFLRAQVGVKEFYHSCPSMFTCNTPYASAKGSDIQSKSSMKKARELLKSSGYDGTPVVIMK